LELKLGPEPAFRLRPMSVGDLLDEAIRLYRNHFVTFVGIVALWQVPLTILQTIPAIFSGMASLEMGGQLAGGSPDYGLLGQSLAGLGLTILAALLNSLITGTLINGALARAMAASYLGQPIGILEAYHLGWRTFLSLFGAIVIATPVFMILYFGVISLICCLIALPALIWIIARWSVFTQTIVLENLGPLAGLRRSQALTDGHTWRIIGILLALGVFLFLLTSIPEGIAAAITFLVATDFVTNPTAYAIITALQTLVSMVSNILVLPLGLAVLTLLYFDLKVRKEGFDLEMRAKALAKRDIEKQILGSGDLGTEGLRLGD